jgi:RIO-like serine/threonine protein kinase
LNKTYLKLTLDLDFILIAVTAPLKDYVLCHKINTRLNLDFKKVEDHEIFFNIDEPAWSFSKYYYFKEQGEQEFYLLSNRSIDGLLIPEMSNVDFFIVIREFIDQEDLSFLLNGLNKLPDIQVAAKIEPSKLKSKENLMV